MPASFMSSFGLALQRAGFLVLPIPPRSKAPGHWTGRDYQPLRWNLLKTTQSDALVQTWATWPQCGIGIVCGQVVAVDLDIDDEALQDRVYAIVNQRLGVTPAVRIGRAPRRLLVYRATQKFTKMSVGKVMGASVEILGDGQQFVAYGVHPDGHEYRWIGDQLADLKLDELPEVTHQQLWDMLQEIKPLLPEADEALPSAGGNHISAGTLEGTLEAIDSALSAIPNPDLSWDDWNRVGMALYGAVGDEGWRHFDGWSATSSKYDRKVTEQRWASYRKSPPTSIGAGTIYHLAERHGWKCPPGIQMNGERARLTIERPVRIGGLNSPVARRNNMDATSSLEAPQPLRRTIVCAEPYPLDALGLVLGNAARAIIDKIQCPDAIAAQSVLAVASLAAQAHANVVHPVTGHERPLSLFLVTVAASGERKSASDAEAQRPVRRFEEELGERYSADLNTYERERRAWDKATEAAEKSAKGDFSAITANLAKLGPAPEAPLDPMITCTEPTLEGLTKHLQRSYPSQAIFNDEGAGFIGGHAMSKDAIARTAAGLSQLWDGSPIKRVRAGDAALLLRGRRLALHLMAQPDVAANFLSDPLLLDQGFLSRILVASPTSTAGSRFFREPKRDSEQALRTYESRILSLLKAELPLAIGKRNELAPARMTLTPLAIRLWTGYLDSVERDLAPGCRLEPVRGFANKLAEQALRIAGVLTLVANPQARQIDDEAVSNAMTLCDFYANEALRLFDSGYVSPELRNAETLLAWLEEWEEDLISVRAIVQRGPSRLRVTSTVKATVKMLEEAGWLQSNGSGVVNGENCKKTWRIVRPPTSTRH